ncbi:MAG: hypothetical protein JJU46_00985 [Balneolaceae bacterium]|nr:hypothetical protein [Balneolaceae bacterium]MCH8547416.1 hypothetical protein [Balneolaceae bacterium]
MKTFSTLLSLSIFILVGAFHQPAEAQTDDTLYLKVDYFKATGPQTSEYLEIEQEIWKALHEERLNRGIILSWDFYAVVAGEPYVPYNYVAINVFDDFSKIDYFDLDDIMNEVYPDKSPDELMERTRAAREVVRTEIWQVNGRIMDEGQTTPGGNYLTINYFDARGGSGEHVEMELDFWGRIHETRIDREILNSWAMYTMLYPSGDAAFYTYSTVDYYDELGDLREPVGTALAAIAHPDLSDEELDKYFTRTADSRSVFKTELWKRIDHVGDEPLD